MLNKEQIMEILPHRPPMLLVDEILEMDENHVVGALHLTVYCKLKNFSHYPSPHPSLFRSYGNSNFTYFLKPPRAAKLRVRGG